MSTEHPSSVVTLAPRMPAGFRAPPLNIEAEQALLGAILINNTAYHNVSDVIRPEYFYEPVHQRIYEQISHLISSGSIADPVMLKRKFDDDPSLRELNGSEYLARICLASETILNARDYAIHLRDLAVRRGMIELGETIVNEAYDPDDRRPASEIITRHHQLIEKLEQTSASSCSLPAVKLDLVSDGLFTRQRWLIDPWLPVGNAGLLSGPGSGGKSYLELILLVCLASGTPFLGFEPEPCPVLGYFAEDDNDQLAQRLDQITRALDVDLHRLDREKTLTVVSTKGHVKTLFSADRYSLEVAPTDWFHRVHERARHLRARYVSFDNIARYWAVDFSASTQQAFSAFGYADQLATSIDGCVKFLHHPSKAGLKQVTPAGQAAAYDLVGGSSGLVNAPRFVHTLRWFRPSDDDDKFRLLQSHKANYGREVALRLVQNGSGIVENDGELDPDDLKGGAGKLNNPRGKPSRAEHTLTVLQNLFQDRRTAVGLDEIVGECIRRGIVSEAAASSKEWRDRRRTVRAHLNRFTEVDRRDDDMFAIKPGET